MLKKFISFFLIAFFSTCITSQINVSERQLNNNWKFSEKGKNNWYPANVPGCIHTDLINNGSCNNL